MTERLRVAALIDLPRSPKAGGHVKCWERLAEAAAESALPLDLTVYFSGAAATESLGPHARFRQVPPIFSTAKLKFIPYVPEHTDLAPYHPHLARELHPYDVLHTTDGFFAFAKTAEHVSRTQGIPLTTSFHTDTPSYTRIFTRQTIEKMLGRMPRFRRMLLESWKVPERQERKMERKLKQHLSRCAYALVTREEDHALAESILGKERVRHLRLGVDKTLFGPHRRDRAGIERDYGIPPNRILLLFVGRVDIGKNIHTLMEAMEGLITAGVPLHLIMAGAGPMIPEIELRLKGHVSAPGYIGADEIARLYASVDALALCSEVEIRSMAAMEAIASGCPVLVSEKSGVAPLFHNTSAMEVIAGGAAGWRDALLLFAAASEKRERMHEIALAYRRAELASWQDVLKEDLFPVWKAASAALRKAA